MRAWLLCRALPKPHSPPPADRPLRSRRCRLPARLVRFMFCGARCLSAERGGDPEVVRESQRRRYKDVGLVDRVLELDAKWREGELRCRPALTPPQPLFFSPALFVARHAVLCSQELQVLCLVVPEPGCIAVRPAAAGERAITPWVNRHAITSLPALPTPCSPRQPGHPEHGLQQAEPGDRDAAQGAAAAPPGAGTEGAARRQMT